MFQFLMGVAFGAAGYWAWQSFGRDLLGMSGDPETTYGGFSSGTSSTSFGSPSSGSNSGTTSEPTKTSSSDPTKSSTSGST